MLPMNKVGGLFSILGEPPNCRSICWSLVSDSALPIRDRSSRLTLSRIPRQWLWKQWIVGAPFNQISQSRSPSPVVCKCFPGQMVKPCASESHRISPSNSVTIRSAYSGRLVCKRLLPTADTWSTGDHYSLEAALSAPILYKAKSGGLAYGLPATLLPERSARFS